MKKSKLIIIISVCVAIVAVAVILPFALKGGKDKTQAYDPESRPLVFAIGALDNNFNPFFSTTANDGAVAGMTQIGMLSSDANGLPDCGEDVACVVLDYTTSYFDKDGNPTPNGTMDGTTEYEFVIKNGIKFSDGQPLTIKDVLFNLYVYLDPAYSGSSTIYSTDIQGLKAYRAQDPSLGDDSDADYKKRAYGKAQTRIQALVDYWKEPKDKEMTEQMEADVDTIKKLFKEEVTTDWNNNQGSVQSYQEEGFTFTEDWEVYFWVEQNIGYRSKMNENGAYVKMKDENGKYITTLDDDPTTTEIDETSTYYAEVANVSSEEKINEYITAHPKSEASDMTDAEYREYVRQLLIKEWAIDVMYQSKTSTNDGLTEIVGGWATGMNALEEFANEEMSKEFEENGKSVDSISGITTHKTSNFNGKDLGEQHDVLSIKINGIDPKAIWNFAFTVTPMHYYSGSYEGVDYVKTFNAETGNFGLKFGSKDFMDTVIAAEEKNMLPMGAGTYKASSANGKPATKETFVENNVVHYERNTYFETVGTEISNAKIKYFRYKVTSDSGVLDALASGGIDFGEPSATTENVSEVGKHSHLAYKMYETGGYGYVGINPKAIKNVYIRRAIMQSLDTSIIIQDYYKGTLAKTIYRPMSATSWAYPKDAEEYYDLMLYENNYVEYIQGLLRTAGCTETDKLNDAGYRIWKDKDNKDLKYTFTIAGETEDHPAFSMFKRAEQYLEKAGFDISVKTDIQALKKLATGDLEVWAAAWSSGIDPDMYQVYHKDSTATSVRNWGYPQILNSNDDTYEFEYGIIQQLSKKIEEGRETLVQATREGIYAECLDLVMELAVEFPTYQRNDLSVYNKNVIDITTLNSNPTHNEGVVSKLWEVNYN